MTNNKGHLIVVGHWQEPIQEADGQPSGKKCLHKKKRTIAGTRFLHT